MAEVQDLVIRDVLAERQRQDSMWGEQDHALPVWMLILAEEVGEAAEAVLDRSSLRLSGDKIAATEQVRTEIIHVAAVAVQILEWIDRQGER